MKRFILILVGSLLAAGTAWAVSNTFTVSATMPDPPTAVSITVSSVSTASGVWTTEPAGTTSLTFDPMTFDTTNNIYLPNHFYAVDFGVTGGPGTPDVTFTYTEGTNPNGASNGLGYKSAITFAKETALVGGGNTETLLNSHGPKKRLIDVNGEHVTSSELSGGWLRTYLGVCTGNPSNDPSGCQPFSNADAAGTYTGSIFITSVVN